MIDDPEIAGRFAGLIGAWPVLGRVVGLVWVAPALGMTGLSGRTRLAIAAGLWLAVAPVVATGRIAPTLDAGALGRLVAGEVVVGAMMGLAASLIVAAARQAGEVVGLQAGLAPASVLAPDGGDALTPMGHLYGLVALGVFLAVDGPLTLVTAVVRSYEVVPVGGPPLTVATVAGVLGLVGEALGLSLRLAAPVALSLMGAGLALGLVGRAAPVVQLLSMAWPVRALAGLALAAVGLSTMAAACTAAWSAILGDPLAWLEFVAAR